MGGTTAKGYPYPTGTDRVMDGDNAIKALADKVDAQLPARSYVGTYAVSLASAVNGTVTVTLPSGRFTVAPRVFPSVKGTTSYFAYLANTSPASVTIGVRQFASAAATATISGDLLVMQMLADNPDG